MKKALAALTLLAAHTIFAQDAPFQAGADKENALLQTVSGQVMVKTPGGVWLPAESGTLLSDGTLVLTGFTSGAEIFISGTTVKVEPLSRYTVRIPKYIANAGGKGKPYKVVLPEDFKRAAEIARDFSPHAPVGTDYKSKEKLVMPGNDSKPSALSESFDDLWRQSGFPLPPAEVPAAINLTIDVKIDETAPE